MESEKCHSNAILDDSYRRNIKLIHKCLLFIFDEL